MYERNNDFSFRSYLYCVKEKMTSYFSNCDLKNSNDDSTRSTHYDFHYIFGDI